MGSYYQFASVFHARPRRTEIDFVGPWMAPVAIEGKYVDDKWKQEALALSAYTDAGIMATRGILDLTEKAWAVPAAMVAWLIG